MKTDNTLKDTWLRTPEALSLLGVVKSTLYSYADFSGGEIKTSSLRKRGKTRGIRLWSKESIEAFIEVNTEA